MKTPATAIALAAAMSAMPIQAQPITATDLMQHIRILAADDYEGRAVGTAGGERTEAYILEAFANAGLKGGAGNGTWRQPVRMVERTVQEHTMVFTAGGKALPVARTSLAVTGRDARSSFANAPVMFVGYGTAGDISSTDVRGALLLMLSGEPAGGGPPSRARRIALAEAGASGILLINPADADWKNSAPAWSKVLAPEQRPNALVQGLIANREATSLLETSGRNPAELIASARREEFRAIRLPVTATAEVSTHFRRFDTANIVGKIEGTSRPDEAVILMGHWDHTGICAPETATDRICNGAVDNASGIATIIEVARALAKGSKPERSIYFLATTLEESGGFMGATAFAEAPPPPIRKIAAVLNVDSTAIHPRGLPVAILGRSRFPALARIIDQTSRELGRKIDLDDEANVMIERQDGWAFTQRGIPSVMASGSFSDMSVLRGYLGRTYHQPNDDLHQTIELGGTLEDAELHIALLRALADPQVYPAP